VNDSTAAPLTAIQRYFVLSCAILAWLLSGIHLSIPPLAARQAVASMGVVDNAVKGRWFSWYVCAFLLGCAVGGALFGWLGDRRGRQKALGLSVLTYSLVAGACYFVTTPWQLLVMWFIASTGVGGVWPNGVSLATETLPGASRPLVSGVFGTAVNIGLMGMSALALKYTISPDNWRWVMQVAAAPSILGVIILLFMPESAAWLASRNKPGTATKHPARSVFHPPLLRWTLIGIALGTVPQMGNWGGTNWTVPWAKQIEEQFSIPNLGANAQWAKSCGAVIGSLTGGFLAGMLGRRTSYFLISLISLGSSLYLFGTLKPQDDNFLRWVFLQGIFGTIYFGWMPLYMPELFPTSVRATGTGVAFNWGRILTAVGVLMAGQLLVAFGGDYGRVGRWTCLVYILGMVVICFAPDTTSEEWNARIASGDSARQ